MSGHQVCLNKACALNVSLLCKEVSISNPPNSQDIVLGTFVLERKLDSVLASGMQRFLTHFLPALPGWPQPREGPLPHVEACHTTPCSLIQPTLPTEGSAPSFPLSGSEPQLSEMT